ncbi:MAG: PAS domain S-box protein [Solirubrobacterales bacterium]|nr:PAS domain S-box protein [Solirubrobacterales bacterium]
MLPPLADPGSGDPEDVAVAPAPAAVRRLQFADPEELAHVGSWELELTENRVRWSDEMCRILGVPIGSEPTWAEYLELVHPDDRSQVPIPQARLDDRPTDAVYRIVRPNGEVRHVHGRRRVRRDHRGQITHYYGSVQDITERHEAELARRAAQQLFETAFSQAPIGMVVAGLDERWVKVNQAMCEMLGRAEHELLMLTFEDVTHPDDQWIGSTERARLRSGEIERFQVEKRYLRRDGEAFWALTSVSLVRDVEGRPSHYVSQVEDITERRRAEERLRAAEAEARVERDHVRSIISAMGEGYALMIDGEIKVVNDALCALTGFSEEELVGSRAPYPFWAPEHSADFEDVRRRVHSEQGGIFEVVFRRASGERFDGEVRSKPARDAEGNIIGFVHTLRDVSAERRQHRELERLALTDSLTGLANRHVLQDALAREAGRRASDSPQLALVLLDLDRFKAVNDEHGHQAGDHVLIEVARRLSRVIRAGEVLARVGGEEFAWLLPASSVPDALAAAERAREAISSRPFGDVGSLTISAGVALLPTPTDGDALYRLADRALYAAKQSGRDRTCCQFIRGVPAGELALVPPLRDDPPAAEALA